MNYDDILTNPPEYEKEEFTPCSFCGELCDFAFCNKECEKAYFND